MRLYFHLAAAHDVILDEVGIEVDDLEHARSEAILALVELRAEDYSAVQDFRGWRLEVADASGVVVFSIDLTDPDSR
jgi:hypothetical protein